MNMDVLDRDLLLPAFAPLAIQRGDQLDENATGSGGRFAQPLRYFEWLL